MGELTFWSPLIITALLAILVSPNYWAVFASIYAIWVWLLPAIPIQLLFITIYKYIFISLSKKERKENKK